MALGTLVILGSGETAPNMVKVHRDALASLSPVNGVLLDTPFGFQENVPQLTEKILEYFSTSLQVSLSPASFRRVADSTDLDRARYVDAIAHANFVFAGPGSPSYAVAQWAPLQFGDVLHDVLRRDGVVTFASAAALTLGKFTAPIYEIYKVGADPHWVDGLDLLGRLGLSCVVIPHYDNAEGQNHDTRFCYLGERRLRVLEDMLDDDVATFGIDEHTAAIINFDARTMRVRGRGQAYWRVGGDTRVLGNEQEVSLDDLATSAPRPPAVATDTVVAADDDIDALAQQALQGGDIGVRAIAHLCRLAATGGTGYIDPTSLIDGILVARSTARELKQFQLADQLRDALVAGGVEIHDTPQGATWSLRA